MGRLQGPRHRMCRRVGERLCSSEKCPAGKRQQPPGVHGPKGYQRLTEFGTQLREKQKAKFTYGVMDRQLRRYYEEAIRRTGNTAENFLRVLERRLDNVVFRLGLAKTRQQARQIVNHGWVNVNGKRVTIPSYQIKIGDVISLKEKAKGSALLKQTTGQRQKTDMPSWLIVDEKKLEGKIVSLPNKDEFPANLNATLIVEYYSR